VRARETALFKYEQPSRAMIFPGVSPELCPHARLAGKTKLPLSKDEEFLRLEVFHGEREI
jgi:hypothetical protein